MKYKCPDCPTEFDTYQAKRSHEANAHGRIYARRDIKHGTVAGYQTHRRRKDPACEMCKMAWRMYYRETHSSSGR